MFAFASNLIQFMTDDFWTMKYDANDSFFKGRCKNHLFKGLERKETDNAAI